MPGVGNGTRRDVIRFLRGSQFDFEAPTGSLPLAGASAIGEPAPLLARFVPIKRAGIEIPDLP